MVHAAAAGKCRILIATVPLQQDKLPVGESGALMSLTARVTEKSGKWRSLSHWWDCYTWREQDMA